MTVKPINRSVQFLTLLWLLSVILAGCAGPQATVVPSLVPTQALAPSTYWPTEGWRTSTPEEQGMDSQQLAAMRDMIQKQQLNLHSLLVIRNGYIVSETYFEPYRQDTKHELYSCTKSFIATLVGIAIDKGYIDRTDHRVVSYFSGKTFEHQDAQKESLTLDDLLTMRSGLDWEEGDPIYRAMYQSRDWVKYVLDKSMAQSPGSQFNYCSGCSHVLSAILQQATGLNTRTFAEQNLFKPLGISNVSWETDAAGIPIGGWGLQLTPRDMAKLGYLYLRDGKWAGQQIVSAQWVKAATQKYTETDGQLGYGYQWWIYPDHGAFTALGAHGQVILVIPELDLVVVTTAQIDSHDEIFQLIEQYILPAAQKSQ
jgi:CubicO group peptidase (beta-lactamase class C family)